MPNLSRHKHVMESVIVGMRSIRTMNVVHVKRKANSEVHSLTRQVVIHIVDSIWLKEITPSIDIVIREQDILF
jgi:hypothetical protein